MTVDFCNIIILTEKLRKNIPLTPSVCSSVFFHVNFPFITFLILAYYSSNSLCEVLQGMQEESSLLFRKNRINFNIPLNLMEQCKTKKWTPNFVLEITSKRWQSAQRKQVLIIHCTTCLCSENSLDSRAMKWLSPVYTVAFDFSNERNFVVSKSAVYDFYHTLRNKWCSFTPNWDAIAHMSSPIDLKVWVIAL